MSVVSAGERGLLRSAAVRQLPGTCTIRHRELVRDPQGGETWSWPTDHLINVPCGLEPITDTTTETLGGAGGLTSILPAYLKLPAGTDIRDTDHVIIDGREFEVAAFEPRNFEVLRRVVVKTVGV